MYRRLHGVFPFLGLCVYFGVRGFVSVGGALSFALVLSPSGAYDVFPVGEHELSHVSGVSLQVRQLFLDQFRLRTAGTVPQTTRHQRKQRRVCQARPLSAKQERFVSEDPGHGAEIPLGDAVQLLLRMAADSMAVQLAANSFLEFSEDQASDKRRELSENKVSYDLGVFAQPSVVDNRPAERTQSTLVNLFSFTLL